MVAEKVGQDLYVLYENVLLLPMKKKKPEHKQNYFRKEIEWTEANRYWVYVKEDSRWSLYYVNREKGNSKRLAMTFPVFYKPESIIVRIKDKEITVHDCDKVEQARHKAQGGPKITVTNNWSIQYEGKHIFELLKEKPNMTYAEILNVIVNEGGCISPEGIIQRGSATNKVVEV